MKVACLNPGHSGSDPGNIAFGVEEEDLNFAICTYAAAALSRCGVAVKWTRGAETKFATKAAELAHIKKVAHGCDVLVSVHNDSGPKSAHGISVLFRSDKDKRLADDIYDRIDGLTPWGDRGLKYRTDLYVFNAIGDIPTALVETDFNTNKAAHALLVDKKWQKKVGEGIARGICDYLKVEWEPIRVPAIVTPAEEARVTEPVTQTVSSDNQPQQPVTTEAPQYLEARIHLAVVDQEFYQKAAAEKHDFILFKPAVKDSFKTWE